MESSPVNWTIGTLFLVLGALGLYLTPGFWSGRYGSRLHTSLAPMGKRLGRSLESTVPLLFPIIAFVGVMVVLTMALGPGPGDAPTLMSTVLTLVLLGLLAVLFLVVLFNRPRWVIPPHLRKGHDGLLGGLLGQRDRHRSTP